MRRTHRKRWLWLVVGLLVIAAGIAGNYLWTTWKPQRTLPKLGFNWQSGFSMKSNDVLLKVEAVPIEHGTEYQTTIIDLRSSKLWQQTLKNFRPIHLCDDRSHIILADIEHDGTSVHLTYWDFRQNNEGKGKDYSCLPIWYFDNRSRVIFRSDGQYLAIISRPPRDHGYELSVGYQHGGRRTILKNQRYLDAEFDGDRLLIDDGSLRYALDLHSIEGQRIQLKTINLPPLSSKH